MKKNHVPFIIILASVATLALIGTITFNLLSSNSEESDFKYPVLYEYSEKGDRELLLTISEVKKDENGEEVEYVKNYYACDGYDFHVGGSRIDDSNTVIEYEDDELGKGILYGNCFVGEASIGGLINAYPIGKSAYKIEDIMLHTGEDDLNYVVVTTRIMNIFEAPVYTYAVYNLDNGNVVVREDFDPRAEITINKDDPSIFIVKHQADMCEPIVKDCVFGSENGSGIYKANITIFINEMKIERTGDYQEDMTEMVEEMKSYPFSE